MSRAGKAHFAYHHLAKYIFDYASSTVTYQHNLGKTHTHIPKEDNQPTSIMVSMAGSFCGHKLDVRCTSVPLLRATSWCCSNLCKKACTWLLMPDSIALKSPTLDLGQGLPVLMKFNRANSSRLLFRQSFIPNVRRQSQCH